MSNKPSDYGSLADRTAGAGPSAAAVDRRLPAGVHVWAKDGAGELAGLLAGWVQQPAGWWGRVILVTDGQPTETLIRADLLRKAE